MKEKFWCGEGPKVCQICDRPITNCFVDGKTQWDCWAFMCKDCWEMHGEGLGTGLGQMYGKQSDGRWLKINDAVFAEMEASLPPDQRHIARQIREDGGEPSLIKVHDDHTTH